MSKLRSRRRSCTSGLFFAYFGTRAQTPPNYLCRLTAEERRRLQVSESFLGPLGTPIKRDAFSAYLRDRYDMIRADFINHVRQSLV
jgi:hypothetical protein